MLEMVGMVGTVNTVWHLVDSAERNPHGMDEAHTASLTCWCEPLLIEMGCDVGGSPIYIVNHHTTQLFCCSKHIPNVSVGLPPFIFYTGEPGTGPFSDVDELDEVVTTLAGVYEHQLF